MKCLLVYPYSELIALNRSHIHVNNIQSQNCTLHDENEDQGNEKDLVFNHIFQKESRFDGGRENGLTNGIPQQFDLVMETSEEKNNFCIFTLYWGRLCCAKMGRATWFACWCRWV